MHKLQRPNAPACLTNFRHGQNNWSNVNHNDKEKIWQQLDTMQQKRCAYCEDSLIDKNGERKAHIEHLRQRSRYPQGTFQWDNLFGSCNRQNSCGSHKDRQPSYNPADIIKMDVEDPEDFFMFISDGTIIIRAELSEQDKNRAAETLRVFNLNSTSGPLRHIRKIAVKGYLQTAEELLEMATEFDKDDWYPLLQEELNITKHLPFSTAIKHILTP